MAGKKKEPEVKPEPTTVAAEPKAELKPDCQTMALCVALGEPGTPAAEVLHQAVLVALNEKKIEEAGAALAALYADLDPEDQRDFVSKMDFTLGRLGHVARNLPERYIVK